MTTTKTFNFQKISIVFLLLLSQTLIALGQSSPAGIGTSSENVLWLRADNGTSTTTNLSPVSSWNDISGNANHSVQANVGNQPLYILSGINSLPSIRFDGFNDYFTVPDADNLDNTNGISVFVVVQPTGIDANPRGIVSKRVDQGIERAYSLFTHTSLNLHFDSPDRINGTTAVTNSPQVLSGVYNGSVSNPRARVFQNGVQTGSGNSGTSIGNMASDLHIGILNPGYAQGFLGDLSEVIVYRNNLNLAQRLIVEAYLANRYNISITPTSYSSTTHNHDFIGIGHASGDKYSQTNNVGSGILLSERNGTLDETNEFVFAGHDGTVHGTNAIELPTITGVNLDERWDRIYYIERVQDGTINAGTTDIRISFDFAEAGITLSTSNVYYLLYRSGTSGSFSEVPGGTGVASQGKVSINISSANFASGYYTIARSDQEVRTWYTINNGNWDNHEVWSLKFNEPDNPLNEIPGIMDRVVIQNNHRVTVAQDYTQCGVLDVIDGIVDFGETTGNSFSSINGQANGKILLAADNFPAGDASGFADASAGGTVEYYGTGYNLSTPRTYRNMIVDLANTTDQLVLLSNYTLNGSLTVSKGELHFGNNISTVAQSLTVHQNFEVSSDGTIRTGQANARHQLNLYGDFTNNGNIQFTNRTVVNYNAEATNGIVDVNFLSAMRNQNMLLEGPTRFYRIAIEKGISSTYELFMEATDVANFELFGYANEGHPDNQQLTRNNNSFGLAYGTVRVGSNITIPRLNGSGNYNISENAILWADGGTVTKPSGTAVVVYGKVKVSSGTFNAEINSGITTRINGSFESTGGTTNLGQFRTSTYGSQHQGGYVQSGGTVNLVPAGIQTDYYKFCLTYPGNVFNMSGGILHIQRTGGKGGVFINSDEVNQKVTGGTVICEISDNNDFIITSKAPFWDLDLRKTANNTNSFTLDEGVDVGGTNEYLAAQPLKVLRNFYIRGTESAAYGVDFRPVTSTTNVNDVYIGGSFYIESGSQYWTAADGRRDRNYNGAANLPTIFNTTHFNQTAGTPAIAYLNWYNKGDILNYDGNATNDEDENMAEFGGFALNRTTGNELRVASSASRSDNSLTIDVNGDLVVEAGTLCQGRFTIRTWASVTNKDRLGTYYTSGPYPTTSGTPGNAQIRFRESEDSAPIINSTENAIFGNTRFNVNPSSPFKLKNSMYFERLQLMRGVLYLGSYNMKVDDLWDLNNNNNTDTDFFIEGAGTSSYLRVSNIGRSTGTGSNQQIMIITDGKASDGGLSLKVSANSLPDNGNRIRNNLSLLTFPIGFSTNGFATELTNTYYRPAQVKVTDFQDDGYLTIRPVRGELSTTDPAGGKALQHYWRVNHSDFIDLPTLAYRFYYKNQSIVGVVDLPSAVTNEANYVPGKVLNEGTYQRAYESNNPAELDIDGVYSAPVDGNTRVIVFNGDNTGATDDGLFGFSANAPGITAENSSYTAGVYQRFIGTPPFFHSRVSYVRWDNPSAWVENQVPTHGSIVIIRDGHRMTGGATQPITQIPAETILQGTDARVQFYWPGTFNLGIVKGYGIISFEMNDNPTVIGDFGEFSADSRSRFLYFGSGTGTYTLNNIPQPAPSITFETVNYIIDQEDLVVNFDFQLGHQHRNVTINNDVLVKRNLSISDFDLGGALRFPGSGNAVTLTVEGDVIIGDPILVINPGVASTLEHKFIVGGNITINEDNLTLFNASDRPAVILELKKEGNNSFINNTGNTPRLHKIAVNKGKDATSSFTFNTNFTLNGPTNGLTEEKALQLQNGKLILNSSGIDINLSTGGGNFFIPSTSGLVVQAGRVNLSGANNGILLDGLLRVENGGTINMDGGAGVNNYIEYSASGKATIEVDGGDLIVGSQIRRGTDSADGILRFIQNGGNVVVGKNAAPIGNRGVFEVLNTGSRFVQSGGTITVVRPQTAATVASVLLEPSLSFVTNSTLQLGNDDTPPASVITLKSKIELGNVTVSGVNKPTARLINRSLTVKRDFTIDTDCTFDGGLFNLRVNGYIEINGTDNLNVDTLFLSGNSTFPSEPIQNITGNVRVKNLVVNPQTSVTLQPSSVLEIDKDMYLNNGQLIDGGNKILVKGNVTNNASHLSSDPSIGGFVFNGSSLQRIYGTGQFGRIEVDNTQGVQLENSISLENNLTLSNGILQLQSNKLTLGLNAEVIGSGFNDNKMIAVGGGDFLKGIQKTFPVVSTAAPADPYDKNDPAYTSGYSFTFPLGVDNGTVKKYTPVEFYVASNNTQGSVNLHPVNRKHITFDETQTDVLQYYWILNSSGLSNFTSLMHTHYKDILPGNDVVGDESAYIGAKLYDNFWAKYEEDAGPPVIEVVHEADDYVAFISDGADFVTGEYTAGIETHIPDKVPIFYSKQDGDWTNPATWEREDGGVVPANGPAGQRVHIRTAHTVTVSTNYRRAYRTTINGRLELGETINHILGYVNGTGTLSVERNSLPAGDYTGLFACGTGGTMEWAGGTYGLPSSITQYNNLTITGTGIKDFPSISGSPGIVICGNLVIDNNTTLEHPAASSGYYYTTIEGNVSLLDNATWDLNTRTWVTLRGDFTKVNTASVNATYSYQTFYIDGSGDQTFTGDFTGSNWFNNLYFTNSNNIIFNGPASVRTFFYMHDGRVQTSSSSLFTVTRAGGNGLINYIDGLFEGPVSINMRDPGTTKKFLPVGKNGIKKFIYPLDIPSSLGYWTGEYFNTSPTSAAMSHTSMDDPPLKTISQSEYWRITGPNGASSRIQLTLDGTSDIAAGIGNINNLRIVYWNGVQWQVAGGGASVVGSITAGTISTTGSFTFDGTEQFFTLGTVETVVIPTARITSTDAQLCAGDTYQLVISLTGNSPWEIDYSDGVTSYTNVNVPLTPHTINITGMAAGSYTYTIDVVRDNIATVGFVYGSNPLVEVYANHPSPYPTVTSGGDICGGTTTTVELNGSDVGFTYELFRDGLFFSSLVGTGGALTYTGIDQAGNYGVIAYNSSFVGCSTGMNGSADIKLGLAATAQVTSLISAADICEGDAVEMEITLVGTPPFTFTVEDNNGGSWSVIDADFGGAGPYTYNFTTPNQYPTWTGPDLPNVFNYNVTTIIDNIGCGAGSVIGSGVNVNVFKIPETGPQYHIPNTFGE